MTKLSNSRLTARLRRFLREEDAIVTLEFAFVLPIMLVVLLGMVDLGNGVVAHRATTAAAQTAADVVAQERQLSDAEVAVTFMAVRQIISPSDPSYASATLYSLVMASNGQKSVDWSETMGPNPPATSVDVPGGLLRPDSSIIVATVTYAYPTAFGEIIFPFVGRIFPGTLQMRQDAYVRPRRVLSINRVASEPNDPVIFSDETPS